MLRPRCVTPSSIGGTKENTGCGVSALAAPASGKAMKPSADKRTGAGREAMHKPTTDKVENNTNILINDTECTDAVKTVALYSCQICRSLIRAYGRTDDVFRFLVLKDEGSIDRCQGELERSWPSLCTTLPTQPLDRIPFCVIQPHYSPWVATSHQTPSRMG